MWNFTHILTKYGVVYSCFWHILCVKTTKIAALRRGAHVIMWMNITCNFNKNVIYSIKRYVYKAPPHHTYCCKILPHFEVYRAETHDVSSSEWLEYE